MKLLSLFAAFSLFSTVNSHAIETSGYSGTTKTLNLNDGNGQNGFVDEKTQSIGQP